MSAAWDLQPITYRASYLFKLVQVFQHLQCQSGWRRVQPSRVFLDGCISSHQCDHVLTKCYPDKSLQIDSIARYGSHIQPLLRHMKFVCRGRMILNSRHYSPVFLVEKPTTWYYGYTRFFDQFCHIINLHHTPLESVNCLDKYQVCNHHVSSSKPKVSRSSDVQTLGPFL